MMLKQSVGMNENQNRIINEMIKSQWSYKNQYSFFVHICWLSYSLVFKKLCNHDACTAVYWSWMSELMQPRSTNDLANQTRLHTHQQGSMLLMITVAVHIYAS